MVTTGEEMDTSQGPGWRMPAEWEPHEATWIAWPHNRSDWPGKFAPIPWVYTEIVRHLHTGELVHILVNDADAETRASRQLQRAGVNLGRVRFFRAPTNRVWTRDYGPIFVVDEAGKIGATDWHFNGWAKYDDWTDDDRVPVTIAAALHLPSWQPRVEGRRVVLEGGSIDVDGNGLLLTTEECLLSPVQVRNPGLSREQIEAVLSRNLGVQKVLWLGRGIAGDDTHGHVDDIARFVAPGRVAAVVCEDVDDPDCAPLQDNLDRLWQMTDLENKRLEVVELPRPAPVRFAGRRLPASYANFYIGNEKVLVPTFNDPQDRVALGILAELFPQREVVGIHAVDLIWGLGALHCMTQQQPKGHRRPS